MTNNDYDLLVIGAGPGGYVAAIRAAQLGLKAAVIEKDKAGGVCLNVGCIPSKALIHQAEVFQSISGLEELGITVDVQGFDYSKVSAKAEKAANQLSKGIQFLLKKNKVDFISAEVVKLKQGELELADGKKLSAKNIIIATGSRARELADFPFDEERILSSTGVLQLERLPESILILGSGAIGVEFAHILSSFGVEVHLVEMLERVLPIEDEELVDVLVKSFKKRGIKMYTSTKALSQQYVDGKTEVLLESKDAQQVTLRVDTVLVSAGRIPNTSDLGLEEAGIKLDEGGFVEVDAYHRSSVPGIYAIGDVVRTPLLAHVASKEGEIAVEHIAGASPRVLDMLAVPAATYCEPQLASFGYTEARASEAGIAVKKLVFPYRGIGKAVAVEQSDGMIKILLDAATDELIGAHIVGANATELIHELLLARSAELLPEDVIGMIHAHPTLSEGLAEAMRQAKDGAIHS